MKYDVEPTHRWIREVVEDLLDYTELNKLKETHEALVMIEKALDTDLRRSRYRS